MKCQNCSKQYFCNKKECNPVEWHKTKNYETLISYKEAEKNSKKIAEAFRKTMYSSKEWRGL